MHSQCVIPGAQCRLCDCLGGGAIRPEHNCTCRGSLLLTVPEGRGPPGLPGHRGSTRVGQEARGRRGEAWARGFIVGSAGRDGRGSYGLRTGQFE